jgi:hypothetical protein
VDQDVRLPGEQEVDVVVARTLRDDVVARLVLAEFACVDEGCRQRHVALHDVLSQEDIQQKGPATVAVESLAHPLCLGQTQFHTWIRSSTGLFRALPRVMT